MTGDNRGQPPVPPWSQVIATTLRLWWQRHVRNPTARQARRRRRYRRVSVAALVVALAAVSGIAIELALNQSSTDPSSDSTRAASPAPDSAAVAAAAADRQQAAAWVADQVGHGVIVACDPLMCAALEQHGFPAANLAPFGPGASNPLGSGIIVSTAAVRSQLGTRLATVYAPLVIASFGARQSQVQVRVTAPDGAAPYMAAVSSGLHARQAGGRDLLGNKNLRLPAGARAQLAAGQVDIRLMITLAALAHKSPVHVLGFGDAGPGAQAGALLRSVAITSSTPSYKRRVLAFLGAQRAPLLPLTAVSSTVRTTVITIEFTAPSPTGLLNQN